MADAYVTVEEWLPRKDDFPVAALTSYLYPPQVSVSKMPFSSPRAGEGSPTGLRGGARGGSFFITETTTAINSAASSAYQMQRTGKDKATASIVPSSYEQQQARCRYWHHEFHRLLVDEVNVLHQKLHSRQARRQGRSSGSNLSVSVAGGSASTMDVSNANLSTAPPAAVQSVMEADDDDAYLLGEDSVQQQLLGRLLLTNPVPDAFYGSVLPSAPKPSWLAPGVMSQPMSAFLEEFETACIDGASAVLAHIVGRAQSLAGSLMGSQKASPSNRSVDRGSLSGSPSWIGSARAGNPNMVRPLEDHRGLDTENFFVYQHMVFNVLHLMEEEVMALFGCVENAEKAAAAEVRGLEHIVHIAAIKGSLTLQGAVSAARGAGGTAGASGPAPLSSSNNPSLSVPLVCLVRVRGVSMFVVAQPTSTPAEALIAGPSIDGLHVASTMRHTNLLTSLCASLRVPNASFFVTPQHQKLMSQCPLLGHPELTVTLATKLSPEYEASIEGRIGALHAYRLPFLPVSALRSWVANRKPFDSPDVMEADDDEGAGDTEGLGGSGNLGGGATGSSRLDGPPPTQHTRELLIVQNVARLVSPAADVSQTTLMPHIVSPQTWKTTPSAGANQTAVPTPPRNIATPKERSLTSHIHFGGGGSKQLTSPRHAPSQAHHSGGDNSNRYLSMGRGRALTTLLHPYFVLTLPYELEIPRSHFNLPPSSETTYEDACASTTRRLLKERIPQMLSWFLKLLDNLEDDAAAFIDQFDGEVLKGIFKVWGCNMRYLGYFHGKLCEAIVLRSQTAYAATHQAQQQQAASRAAAQGNGIAVAATAAVAAAHNTTVKSSRRLARQQATVQQPPNLSSSTATNAAPPTNAAASLMRQVAQIGTSKVGVAKKHGGGLFLNRHTPLDAPTVNHCIRETLVGLSGLLSVVLEGDAAPPPATAAATVQPPHVPQATAGGSTMGRRASLLTSACLSSVCAPQQVVAGGGPNVAQQQPQHPSEAIRRPSDRSPLEHLLLVVRAEMIARCFRVVVSEHLRVISLFQKMTGPKEPVELPSMSMLPAVKSRRDNKGGTLLAMITESTGATAGHRSPVHDDHNQLFRSPDAKPLSLPTGGALVRGSGGKVSTTARLYQKLKDLDAILDEKNHLANRRSDAPYTARSLDKISVMDAVQQQKSSPRGNGGVLRPSNPSSVLVDDPHPCFEPDGGIFTAVRPDEEKMKVAELIALLIQNSATTVSAQFWSQIMMSELWAKYGNFLGGCGAGGVTGFSSKREDIQKCDMVVVLMRIGKLCGIEFSQSLKDDIYAQYPGKSLHPSSSKREEDWMHLDDGSVFGGGEDSTTSTRLGRRSLGKLRVTHHSIDALHARAHSTLRRVSCEAPATARPSGPPVDPRVEVGLLSCSVARDVLYDDKVKSLEDELADLQMTRFVKCGKKFKEGLGDAATVREIAILDALIRLYSMGGATKIPHLQLAQAQKENAELVMFYHSVRRLWRKAEFDGICYRPCGGCGVLYNASLSDPHGCGDMTLTKVDKEELNVGVADGKLPNALITASSFAKGCEPYFARRCVSAAAWRPLDVGHEHYMEFSFSTTREVKAIEIEGDGVDRYVRSFQLVYTLDHKDPEIFTGAYYRRDVNMNVSSTAALACNGGKGERMFARPFVHNNAARDKERIRREGSLQAESSVASFEPRSPNALGATAFGSLRWTASIRAQDTMSLPSRAGSPRFGNTGRDQSFTFSRVSPQDLQSTGRVAPGAADAAAATTSSTSGLRPTFLKGNTDAKSVVRIQFETPIRCSVLRFIVGNDDAATAALNIEILYTSRHMPAPGRSGCERIAVNHINWMSPVSLTTFAEPGSMRNLVQASHGVETLKMTRKELATKEKALLERILEIEAEVEDKSPEALARALPLECILIRTSSELQSLWNQLLQLLLMWGMERSSDVQFAQFRLLRYLLAELKLYATCGQLDVAAVRADRLMKKLDDAVGPLGFGGVAMLVGPLMCLIFDALQCAGVAARHIGDFYHMVEWASAVRHPLTIQLVAVLIDAAGYGKEADRERVSQLCQRLASDGRLGDVTKLLTVTPGGDGTIASGGGQTGSEANGFSPAVVAVFEQLCAKEVFMRTSGENANSLYPEESDAVRVRQERFSAAM